MQDFPTYAVSGLARQEYGSSISTAFDAGGGGSGGGSSSGGGSRGGERGGAPLPTDNLFGQHLREFVDSLGECKSTFEGKVGTRGAHVEPYQFVADRIDRMFQDVDFRGAAAALVWSFPGKGVPLPRGHKCLAQAVQGMLDWAPWPAGDLHDAAPIFAGSGSFGDLNPEFLVGMEAAMVGGVAAESSKPAKVTRTTVLKHEQSDWMDVKRFRLLWPSRTTAKESSRVGLMHLRFIAMKVWHDEAKIPTIAAKDRLFFDGRPMKIVVEDGWPSSKQPILPPILHGKFIFRASAIAKDDYNSSDHSNDGHTASASASVAASASAAASSAASAATAAAASVATATANTHAIIYIGSHNLSKTAWGIGNVQPNSVELGVVVSTTSKQARDKWKQMLPMLLPSETELATADVEERKFYPFSTGPLYFMLYVHVLRTPLSCQLAALAYVSS